MLTRSSQIFPGVGAFSSGDLFLQKNFSLGQGFDYFEKNPRGGGVLALGTDWCIMPKYLLPMEETYNDTRGNQFWFVVRAPA